MQNYVLLYPSPKSTRETPFVSIYQPPYQLVLFSFPIVGFFFHMPNQMYIIFYSAFSPLSNFLICLADLNLIILSNST